MALEANVACPQQVPWPGPSRLGSSPGTDSSGPLSLRRLLIVWRGEVYTGCSHSASRTSVCPARPLAPPATRPVTGQATPPGLGVEGPLPPRLPHAPPGGRLGPGSARCHGHGDASVSPKQDDMSSLASPSRRVHGFRTR